jgi:hypothetical protein
MPGGRAFTAGLTTEVKTRKCYLNSCGQPQLAGMQLGGVTQSTVHSILSQPLSRLQVCRCLHSLRKLVAVLQHTHTNRREVFFAARFLCGVAVEVAPERDVIEELSTVVTLAPNTAGLVFKIFCMVSSKLGMEKLSGLHHAIRPHFGMQKRFLRWNNHPSPLAVPSAHPADLAIRRP